MQQLASRAVLFGFFLDLFFCLEEGGSTFKIAIIFNVAGVRTSSLTTGNAYLYCKTTIICQ
jgi:hypothetical protein